MNALEVADVSLRFGGVQALSQVTFNVKAGQICGLIGPNGAGKTSLFNCLSRVYQPNSGSVRCLGRDLLRVPVHGVARLGIGRTFQHPTPFGDMSVLETVLLGSHIHLKTNWLTGMLRLGTRAEERLASERARHLLAVLGLEHVAHQRAADLPYGQMKTVDIARALAGEPTLLLMDEPAAGLTHLEIDELAGRIDLLRKEFDLTILLVEHHMKLVNEVSDHIVVLDFGRKIAEGTPSEVTRDPAVIEAYLGVGS